MKHLLKALLFSLALSASQGVLARDEPVPNFGKQQILTDNADQAKLKKAIKVGATQKGWTVTKEEGDTLRLSIQVRNKHTIVIDVKAIDGKDVEVSYVDSINMNYAVRDGVAVIHPKYEDWVRNLLQAARAAAVMN